MDAGGYLRFLPWYLANNGELADTTVWGSSDNTTTFIFNSDGTFEIAEKIRGRYTNVAENQFRLSVYDIWVNMGSGIWDNMRYPVDEIITYSRTDDTWTVTSAPGNYSSFLQGKQFNSWFIRDWSADGDKMTFNADGSWIIENRILGTSYSIDENTGRINLHVYRRLSGGNWNLISGGGVDETISFTRLSGFRWRVTTTDTYTSFLNGLTIGVWP